MSPDVPAASNVPENITAALIVTLASEEVQTFPLVGEVTAVGRSADNKVALTGDKRASRHHAEIRREEEGYVLYDLGSSNGTFVGQERISCHLLQDGDQVRIGDALLVFSILQREPAVEPTPAGVASESVTPLPSSTEKASISVESSVIGGTPAEAEVDHLLLLAERAEREGKLGDALSLYRQSLDLLAPASPLSREVRSICRELEGQVEPGPSAAAAKAETPPAPIEMLAAEEAPDELRAMLQQAEQMEHGGDIAGAVALYQDLLLKLPAASPLRQEVSMLSAVAEARRVGRNEAGRLVEKAQRLEEQGDAEAALAVYRQAAAEVPPGSALGRELDLVIADLESRSHDRLQMDMAAGHRAEGLEQAGRWADASAAYQELLADADDPAVRAHWEARLAHCQEEMVLADLFQRGVKVVQASDWAQAQHLFNQIVRRRPAYQYNGQMAALWLDAVNRRLSPPSKPRLALWSAAGGVLVLLLLIIVAAAVFVFTRFRQAASATAVADRVATLQAEQTQTAVAVLPTLTQAPTLTAVPTFTVGAAAVPMASLGGFIAFASDRAGGWDIYTIRPDGTQLSRLTDHPAIDTEPAWSPDGSRLAFASDRDGNLEIYVMAADGAGPVRLTDDPAVDTAPAWSPDGQRIVFVSNREGGGDRVDLWLMDADGANPSRLAAGGTEPAWSSDGSRIAAVFGFPSVVTIGLVPVHGGGGPQPLLEMSNSASPTWSPDSSRVAFSAPADGGDHVFQINADGSNVVDLSVAIGQSGRQPTWAPDGRYISFVTGLDGNQDIYIAAVAGGAPVRLTTDPGKDELPAWSR